MFTQLDALLSTEFIYVKIITVGHLFRELLSSNSKFSRKKAKNPRNGTKTKIRCQILG